MGYDMYFRDGGDSDEGYFRLGIWGMRWARDEMRRRGMTFDAGPPPAWPEYGDLCEKVDAVQHPDDYPDLTVTSAEREAVQKILAQCEQVVSWHGPEIPGIPEHKFCTNDGWLVLPAECRAAVRAGRAAPPPAERAETWARWLDYMDRAASHGGFEVH